MCEYVHDSVCLIILQSTLRAASGPRNSVPREGIKKELMGLCLPYEAMVCMRVC